MPPTIVLYEWLLGPRSPGPEENIIVFGHEEARLSADIYPSIGRPRGRKLDIAIAACAIIL
jgi:hypothetical protein